MHTHDDLVRLLLRLPVFAGLGPEAASELATGCNEVQLVAGELLFSQGSPADDLYIVLDGELRVSCRNLAGEEVVVGMAASGAIIGEMGLIDRAPRSASVSASGRALVLRMPGSHFAQLVNTAHPAAWIILRAVREQLVLRLRGVSERVDAVLEPPTDERSSEDLRRELGSIWTVLREGGA